MKSFTKTITVGEVFSIKAESGGARIISGLASAYRTESDAPDTDGDRVLPGAFDDLDLGSIKPKMFFQHNQGHVPIGKWTDLTLSPDGLHAIGEMTPGVRQADDVWTAMQAGTVSHLSIHMKSDQFVMTDSGFNIVRVTDIPEISVVNYPADTLAIIDMTAIKSALEHADRLKDYEAVLRESAGFSKKAASAFVSGVRASVMQGEPVGMNNDALLQKLKSFSIPTE